MGLQTHMVFYARKKQETSEGFITASWVVVPPQKADDLSWLWLRSMTWVDDPDMDYLLRKPDAAYLSTHFEYEVWARLRARVIPYHTLVSNPVITPLEDIDLDVYSIFILEGDFVFELNRILQEDLEQRNDEFYQHIKSEMAKAYALMYDMKEQGYEFRIEYWFA